MKPIKLIQAAQRAGIRIPGHTRENARARHAARSDAAAAGTASCQDAYVRLTGADRDWELPPPPPDYPDHISTAKAAALNLNHFDMLFLARIEKLFETHDLSPNEIRKDMMYGCILLYSTPVPREGYAFDLQIAPPATLIYAASHHVLQESRELPPSVVGEYMRAGHLEEQASGLLTRSQLANAEIITIDTHTGIRISSCNVEEFRTNYYWNDPIIRTLTDAQEIRQDWKILCQVDPQAKPGYIDYLGATRAVCGDTGKRHLLQRRERPSP